MSYSDKTSAQFMVESLVQYGIEDVIISPGSRNAPLIISLSQDERFNCFSIIDERSAAFFALGRSMRSGKPAALVCTSGSALLNYYPAITEAFYSKVPLIVLSADRPSARIDIGDGQTIRQVGVFKNHIEYECNVESLEDLEKANEAIYRSLVEQGPVHINLPFDEPLYRTVQRVDESIVDLAKHLKKPIPSFDVELEVEQLAKYAEIWNQAKRKLVIIGARNHSPLFDEQLKKLVSDPSVLVMTETLSNVENEQLIRNIDRNIFHFSDEEKADFKPDIILSLGGMVVSKKIKELLRSLPVKHHWHVDYWRCPDTYFKLTKHFKTQPEMFFSQFFFLTKNHQSNYQSFWLTRANKIQVKHEDFCRGLIYSDFKVFDEVVKRLRPKSVLHLANSSVVRYAQLYNLDSSIKSFANRGTSGIDGSTSTAIGYNSLSEESEVFISGDVSFFYDSNALALASLAKGLKIILINNGGGGIFRILKGPRASGSMDYFETSRNYDIEKLVEAYGWEYRKGLEDNYKEELERFLNDESILHGVLEIEVIKESNNEVVSSYFKYIN